MRNVQSKEVFFDGVVFIALLGLNTILSTAQVNNVFGPFDWLHTFNIYKLITPADPKWFVDKPGDQLELVCG